MLIITPDIVNSYRKYNVCDNEADLKTLDEHNEILHYIQKQDVTEVGNAMRRHLKNVTDFSKTLRNTNRL